jgi:hypothetical protein
MSLFSWVTKTRDWYRQSDQTICVKSVFVLVLKIGFLILLWTALYPYTKASVLWWIPLLILTVALGFSIVVGVLSLFTSWLDPEVITATEVNIPSSV